MRVRIGGHTHQAQQRLRITQASAYGTPDIGQGQQRGQYLDLVQRQGPP
jgi:hypothetical protein